MGGARPGLKGGGAERELAKILSTILGGSFQRSNNSGAFIGGKNVVRKQTLSKGQIINARGDIVPPDHMPHFVIESKAYKQTVEIVDPDDAWFVAFKINRRGWFIAVPQQVGEDYTFDNYSLYASPHGKVRVTDMCSFITGNKARILEKTS
jgi:hypothetical protein